MLRVLRVLRGVQKRLRWWHFLQLQRECRHRWSFFLHFRLLRPENTPHAFHFPQARLGAYPIRLAETLYGVVNAVCSLDVM